MSERTLKEKPAAKRRTEEPASQETKSLQERGEELKAKLDEVDKLIDEALEEDGQTDLERLMDALDMEEEEEFDTYDGERCPCGHPLDECVMNMFPFMPGDLP